MKVAGRTIVAALALLALLVILVPVEAGPGPHGPRGGPAGGARMKMQHGKQHGRKGGGGQAGMGADGKLIHFLFDHRQQIRRTVTNLPNGVETLTESDNPQVAGVLQSHVASMDDRMDTGRPIHLRDPLFRALFANRQKVKRTVINTAKGVRVTQTSDNPVAARLVQIHAQVVSLFVKNGREEMHKDHLVPL